MVFQCRSCNLTIKKGNLDNHLKWKCINADLWCSACCVKLPGIEHANHTSCGTEEKVVNRTEEFRKLVLESLRNAQIKKKLKGQLRTLAKKDNIPTTKSKIDKFVDEEAKFDFKPNLCKRLAKQMFLTAAEQMPADRGNVLINNWHAECKKVMVDTTKAIEMSSEHKKEIKKTLRSVSQPKVWYKFQTFIDFPTRFSSPEVKDLAWKVYLEAKDKFPLKPDNMEVGTQWERLVRDTLEATDANSADKEALFKILRQKNMPKSRENCEKFLNNPIRFPTAALRELAQQVYTKAAAKTIIRKKKKKIVTGGSSKKGKVVDGKLVKSKPKRVEKNGSGQQKYPVNRNAKKGTQTNGASRFPRADSAPAGSNHKRKFVKSNGLSGEAVEPVAKKSKKANHTFF